METIILKGDNEKVLNLELSDILKLVPDGNDYQWKILWIEGVSKQNNDLDIVSLENKVKTNGLELSFKELETLSLKFFQLIDFVLVGKKKGIDEVNKSMTYDSIKRESDFFIELIDSSYWELTSKNKILQIK